MSPFFDMLSEEYLDCLKSVQSVRSLEGKLEPLRCNWISGEALPVAAGPYLEDTWLTRSSNHYFTHARTHFRSLAFPRESQITTCVFRMLSTESHKVEICRPSHNLFLTHFLSLSWVVHWTGTLDTGGKQQTGVKFRTYGTGSGSHLLIGDSTLRQEEAIPDQARFTHGH